MPLTPSLLDLLDMVDQRAPLARKRLLGPSVNYGREALVALVRRREGAVVGWEATTLRRTADALAFTELRRRGLRVAGDVSLVALTSAALDQVLAGGVTAFGALGASVGFRRAVHDAVMELRTAGVAASAIDALDDVRPVTTGLAAVLRQYEWSLGAAQLVDAAGVFRIALEVFDAEAPFVLGTSAVVVAGIDDPAGLPALLLERLLQSAPAAERWTAPPLADEALAAVQVVRAAVAEDEVLALFRHAAGASLPLDAIECVTDQRDAYGAALHALAARLDLPFTALHGIAFSDSRIGRAMQEALTLLTTPHLDGTLLSSALERRELWPSLPGAHAHEERAAAADLAVFARRERIGGRDERLVELIESFSRAASEHAPERREDEDDAALDARRAAFEVQAAQAVRLLTAIRTLRTSAAALGTSSSAATIARALLQWLDELVPVLDDEYSARVRLRARLAALGATDARPVPTVQAVAEVQAVLDEMRVWPTALRHPYASTGGAVHLTDLRHAGAAGRGVQWFAGLSSDAVRGTLRETPLLDDRTRARLADAAGQPLAGTTERARRRRRQLEHAVGAALTRGAAVVLSWAAGPDDDVAPDRLVLEALRQRAGAADASTKALLAKAESVSAVPRGTACLDDRDRWLQALLADGPRAGAAAVEAAHPALGRWAAMRRAWSDPPGPLTDAHGVVPSAAALVPTISGRSVSATELGELLACPRRWFMARALDLREPDAPQDPDAWLAAAEYGSLVHAVFARAVKESVDFAAATAGEQLRAMAARAIADEALRHPPESAAARAMQQQRLEGDVAVFLQLERRRMAEITVVRRRAERFERMPEGAGLKLTGGRRLRVHARLDRLDERDDASVDVWDYKTGAPFNDATEPHRLVQAMVGAELVELDGTQLGESGFRFATERADGATYAVPQAQRDALRTAADAVLAAMESGCFPPTAHKDAKPCRYCTFAPNCRVSADGSRTASPPARWARAHAEAQRGTDDPVRAVALATQTIKADESDDSERGE